MFEIYQPIFFVFALAFVIFVFAAGFSRVIKMLISVLSRKEGE